MVSTWQLDGWTSLYMNVLHPQLMHCPYRAATLQSAGMFVLYSAAPTAWPAHFLLLRPCQLCLQLQQVQVEPVLIAFVLKALSQYSEMTVTVAFVYMPLISIRPNLLFITLSYVDQQIQCFMILNRCVYMRACVRACVRAGWHNYLHMVHRSTGLQKLHLCA